MDFLVADERTLDCDAVHHLFHAREHVHREKNTRVDLMDLEILGGCDVVLKVEGVQMADGAGDFKKNHVAGVATRMGLAAGVRSPEFQRPDAFERRADQAKSTVLQKLAAGGDQITNCLWMIHMAAYQKL